MKIEEFVRAITVADFVKLVGSERLTEFAEYANAVEASGGDKIIIRVLFQIDQPDGVPLPYYMWLVYPVADGEVQVYPPDFENLSTYLETPYELQGLAYFEIVEVGG